MRLLNHDFDCPQCGSRHLIAVRPPCTFIDLIGATCASCRHLISTRDALIRIGQIVSAIHAKQVRHSMQLVAANEECF
jgi:hypothetical protein